MKYLLVTIFLFLFYPFDVFACIVRHRSADELKKEAGLVIVVKIVSLKVGDQNRDGELYTYKVESLKPPGKEFVTVTYFNVRAREHDGVLECPLKDGSGLETDLEVGSKYRLYLKSSRDKEILFSETID